VVSKSWKGKNLFENLFEKTNVGKNTFYKNAFCCANRAQNDIFCEFVAGASPSCAAFRAPKALRWNRSNSLYDSYSRIAFLPVRG
jgi:hypothetical protein